MNEAETWAVNKMQEKMDGTNKDVKMNVCHYGITKLNIILDEQQNWKKCPRTYSNALKFVHV